MKFDPAQLFFAMLRFVPAMIAVVVAIYFIFSFRTVVITDELQRTNVEIAEAFMSSSRLTFDRAVFDPDQLELIKALLAGQSQPEKKSYEPEFIARHCSIAYRAEFEDLKNGNKWSFGDVHDPVSDIGSTLESKMSYDVSIVVKSSKGSGFEDVHPARLTITTRKTLLSQVGCLAEEAFDFRENRSINVPCIFEIKRDVPPPEKQEKKCLLMIKKDGNYLCLYRPDIASSQPQLLECRYFPRDINIIGPASEYKMVSKIKLNIYPVEDKLDPQMSQDELDGICKSIKSGQMQIATKDINAVVMCIE
jgi:hypothetical protein